MPMDGFTLGLIARELNHKLVGGRVDRVIQPERDELILTIRNGGENHMLLLSSSAGCARAHLTQYKKNSPLEPFNLCMLMRKYLIGGRVTNIEQVNCDRILRVEIEHIDELGDERARSIYCEFMGKHSNLIFVHHDGRIIDSARRVTEAISSVREVLPGLRYELPPEHGKLDFDKVSPDTLYPLLKDHGGTVKKTISSVISGMSSQTAGELAYRVCGTEDAHMDECDPRDLAEGISAHLRSVAENIMPAVLYDDEDHPVDAVAFDYRSRVHLKSVPFPTISAAMDEFYRSRDAAERITQKSAAVHRVLKNNIERCEKKLALQKEALLGSQRMEEYQIYGELLTANLHLQLKGAKSVRLMNYYDPELKEIDIPLDEKINLAANAQKYFKLYRKARNARDLAAEQIRITEEELGYLEGQMDNLGKCVEESELIELREELVKFGYMRPNTNRRNQKSLPPSKPLKFTSPAGRTILVGKNNLQNDKLTFSADPNETWLHVKNMPGSHVIIVDPDPDDETLLYAAKLAATYSKGAGSSNVPVDYTLRKYVKKPSGARPGFVIYTHQHTLYVTPDA